MVDRVLTVRLGADVAAYQRAMQQASGATLGVGVAGQQAGNAVTRSIGRAAKYTAAIATAAAAGGAAKILSIGMAYEQQMNTLQAVTDSTDQKMQQVSATARAMGADLEIPGTSAADAAGAMTELAKGGLSVDQAMAAAKGTLQLAAAAQIEGGAAAEIQSNALNAFSLKATDASHVADVLANTANAASGEITDFAAGLQQSSAVASSFGISLDDTATVLGLFANRGIQGSDAGTSFKTMLIAMANPTLKAQAALDKLGVTVHDSQGNFVGARMVTDQLSQAKARMTQAEFTSAAATAFGTDAMRAAVVMADGGTVAFDAMSAAVGRQGGAATLASAQMEGLSGALGVAQSGAEDVAIEFYERFSPAIEKAVRQSAERLPEIADAVFDLLDRIGEFSAAVGPTVSAGLDQGAADLKRQADQLLSPLIDGAKDLGSKSLPYLIEFGEKAWDAILKVGDAIEPVADAIGRFFQTISNNGFVDGFGTLLVRMGQALVAVGTALRPVGEAIGWLVDQIGKIPGPLLYTLTVMGSLILLAPKLIAGITAMGTSIVARFTAATASVSTFWASLGPVAWAIVGVGTVLAVWAGQNDDAAAAVQAHDDDVKAFTATLDENTGAITGNSEAQVKSVLEGEGKLQMLKDMGVSTQQYIEDIMNQVGAEGKAGDAIRDAGARAIEADENYQQLSKSLADAGISALDLAEAATSGNWDEITKKVSAFQLANTEANRDPGPGMNLTVEKLQNVGGAAQAATDVMGGLITQTDKVKTGLESANRVIEAGSGSIGMFASSGKIADNALSDVAGHIYGIGKNAGALAPDVDAATKAIDDFKAANEEADTAAQGLILTLDAMAGRTPDVDEQIRLLAANIRDYGTAVRDIPAAERDAKQATDDVAQARIDLAQATQDVADAQSHLYDGSKEATTTEEVAEAILKEKAARRGVKDALDAEAAAKNSVKDADDKLIETGRGVYENAIKVASQVGITTTQLYGAAAGAGAVASSMENARANFIQTATAAGVGAREAENLANKLGLVPDEVVTQFIANTAGAQAQIDDFIMRNSGLGIGVRVTGTIDPSLKFALGQYGGGFTGGRVGGLATGGSAGGGGKLPGSAPSNLAIDNLLAMGPKGLLKLQSEEWVVRTQTTRAIGDRGMAMVNSGALNGLIRAAADGQIPAFAGGGSVSLGTSAAALAGVPGRDLGDRLGRVVDALGDLADAVDEAAERYRDARGKQADAFGDLNDVNSDARGKRRDAAKKVAEEEADLARVTREQDRKVAAARKKQTDSAVEVRAAEDRKVKAAQDRLAEAQNSAVKGRAERVAKAQKVVAEAEAARVRAVEKNAKAQATAVEKAELQRGKSIGFAERQLSKAEAAQDKTIKATDRKVAAEQREYEAAVKVTKAARDRAQAAESLERKQAKYRQTLKGLGDTFDKVTDSLGKARDKAAGLREDRAQAANSIASGLAGYGGGITGGNGLRLDAASIIAGRTQNLKDVKAFGANIDALRKKGLNAKSIQEIADAGIDGGGQTAAALAGASRDQIKKLNALDTQILNSAQKTGNAVGDSLFKSGIAAADGIVAGLKSRQESIDKQMRRIGQSMADQMKKALGIKSPSTVMRDQVGVQVVDGIMVGMDSRAGALNAQLDDLVRVPSPTFSNPADGVFSSYSSGSYGGSSSVPSVMEVRFSGGDEVAQMFAQRAEVMIDGKLVKAAQVIVRMGGQG